MTGPLNSNSSQDAFDRAFVAGAWVAGLLSFLVAGGWFWWLQRTGNRALEIAPFAGSWMGIALLASLAAWWAGTADRPHLQTETRRLRSAILPPFAAAVGASLPFCWKGAAYGMSVVWIVCYGLALLSAREVLSVYIARIGWLFLGTGICLLTLVYYAFRSLSGYDRSDTQTLAILALTFGGFHLLYAIGFWMRQRPKRI